MTRRSCPCPLCHSKNSHSLVTQLKRTFSRCSECDLLFLDPKERLTLSEEKARYETHENDVTDPKYQEFVSPLVNWIAKHFAPSSTGLDFGAGTGPVLASELRKKGYQMEVYDPFFWPDPKPLSKEYDFVLASEVVEHFSDPKKEFALLKKLLKPSGVLGLMTLLYDAETDIESWYYLKDPTHICAYSEKTFEWIKQHFTFSGLGIAEPRLIILHI